MFFCTAENAAVPKIEAGLPNGLEAGAPPGAAAAAAAAVAAATTQVKTESSIDLGGVQGLKMDQVLHLFVKLTKLPIFVWSTPYTPRKKKYKGTFSSYKQF